MSKDISKILREWEYDGVEVLVRVIHGDDGREKVQLRVDLGLMQMEMHGRPDGQRPEGRESWLDYYEERAEGGADDEPFSLSDDDCMKLWREAVQYYHRYLSFWHLALYDLCARDTERNMRLFDFVRDFADSPRAREQFDQFRPYVLMMHARAVATPMVEKHQFSQAIEVIDNAITDVRHVLDAAGKSDQPDECAELQTLERWREEVLAEADKTPDGESAMKLANLLRRLKEAVSLEEFEEAARLRDEIRHIQEKP